MAAPATNPYLRTQVLTASPQELRLMLYDGALKFARQARPALEQRDFEQSYQSLVRVQSILMELSNSLNREVMPEVCDRLTALYNFLYRRTVEANVQRDPAILDEVIEILEYERETWRLLMEQQAQPGGQAQPHGEARPGETAAAPDPEGHEMPRFSQSA